MRQIITSTKLDAWFVSTSRDAQELLPHLVRRLIMATTALGAFDEFRMPVGDEIGRTGYDGRLHFKGKNPFIPTGLSVWEMGVGDPLKKATQDYKNRLKDARTDTQFVFVTPHRWSGKDRWLRQKRKGQAMG